MLMNNRITLKETYAGYVNAKLYINGKKDWDVLFMSDNEIESLAEQISVKFDIEVEVLY